MERRCGPGRQTPWGALQQLPALVLLDRFPVPVLAVGDGGAILFANTAFADMVGYAASAITALRFDEIFRTGSTERCAVSVGEENAGL
ncbi:MAG: PAS domain-containing protein, partial [Mycobacteriaceae bacterium]|nr:PAS domain-containing protein [Mycobacteriaceae bacterium]